MKRKDFFTLVQPLSQMIYRHAHSLIPDDLQAEQLVIDSLNAYLLREKKSLLAKEIDMEDKKECQLMRKTIFKGILRHVAEIGFRRAPQLTEQMRLSVPEEFKTFYGLDPKVRFAVKLRFETQFNVSEIEEIVQMPRYEVIEKIHNGRFLLLNDLNQGVIL